jgi:hypothetical protein
VEADEMFSRFGYHCIALRDCTTAYEFADTYEGRWMTRAAIRLMETDLGHTASSEDFRHRHERKQQVKRGMSRVVRQVDNLSQGQFGKLPYN